MSAEHVDRSTLIGDINIDSRRKDPMTTVGSEGSTGTSAPASTPTLPPRLPVVGLVSVP